MLDFDKIIECQSSKCRKWDHALTCSCSGDVPESLIPPWIVDIDFVSPPTVIDDFRRIVKHDAFDYTRCFDEFYGAVIAFQRKRYQVEVGKSWITLAYGTVSALYYAIRTYCKPGDSVMTNTLAYDPSVMAIQRQGVQVLASPLRVEENRYQLNLNLIEEQLKTYRPALWFFCSPYNPPDKIWCEEEIRQVSNPCQYYDTVLVVDEVHVEHILDDEFVSCLASSCATQDNLIVPTSPNKALKLGGPKTSYSMTPNDSLRQYFRQQLEENSIASPNLFGVWGIILVYQHGLPWLDMLDDYLQGNARYLADTLQTHSSAWEMMTPELSYLTWIDISTDGSSATQLT